MMLAATSTGQSLEDKLYAVKYFLSGQGISYMVLKATTSELLGPKKKHLNYLVQMTNEPNVSIPSLVKHLMIRARYPEWSVAFKATVTIHHLITYGNEKFLQNLASSTVNHQSFVKLCSYVDRTTTLGYNMSIFLRRYSRYLNAKIQTYRSLGFDLCRMDSNRQDCNQGNNSLFLTTGDMAINATSSSSNSMAPQALSSSALRYMPLDQLVRTLAIIQKQFDVLLAFDASTEDLCNGVINSAFAMLYKDFVKLYIAYQTAIIRLLELYFTVQQVKRVREMLDVYKKFLVQMSKVADFMLVVDSVGMDDSYMPIVSREPNLSLKLLEKHLETLQQSTPKRSIYCPLGAGGNCSSSSSTLTRGQSIEMPRLDYATLYGNRSTRRRSLRTTPLRQLSLSSTDTNQLSPLTLKKHQQRTDELANLNRMLTSFTQNSSNISATAPATNCDLIDERIEEDLLGDPLPGEEDLLQHQAATTTATTMVATPAPKTTTATKSSTSGGSSSSNSAKKLIEVL